MNEHKHPPKPVYDHGICLDCATVLDGDEVLCEDCISEESPVSQIEKEGEE